MASISLKKRSSAPSAARQMQAFRMVWMVLVLVIGAALSMILDRLETNIGITGTISSNDNYTNTAVRKLQEVTANADVTSSAIKATATPFKVEGTYFGDLRTEGSKDATVMAMASGYNLSVYKNYVGSLRKSGFEGNIILGVKEPMGYGVEEYFKEQRVTAKVLKFVDCTFEPLHKAEGYEELNSHQKEQNTCADPYSNIKLRWSRFPLHRDWLEECKECTGPVLVSDARDTLFQRDPFGVGAPEVKGLQVFQEHHTQMTSHWIVQGPVKDCKSLDFAKPPLLSPMLCSGTTIGTRDAMLKYLTTMYEEMLEWTKDPKCCCNKMNGDDQSIHNYLYYTGKLPFAISVPNRMGIVNTAGVQGSFILNGHGDMWEKEGKTRPDGMAKPYQGAEGDRWIGKQFDITDDQGFFTDFNGERSRVVHQYDRLGLPFNNYLRSHKTPLFKHLNG